MKEQNSNKRNNIKISLNGKNYLLIELAEKYNIPRNILYQRIVIYKWPILRALLTPIKKYKKGINCV